MLSTSCLTCPVNCQAFITLSNIKQILKKKGNIHLGLFVQTDMYRPVKIPKRKATGSSNIPPKKPKSTNIVNPCGPPVDASKNSIPIKPSPQVRKLLNIPDRAPKLVDQSPESSRAAREDDNLSSDIVTEKEHSVSNDSSKDSDSEPEIVFVKEKENSTPAKVAQNSLKKDSNPVPSSQSKASSSVAEGPSRNNVSTPISNPKILTKNTPTEVNGSKSMVKMNGIRESINDTRTQSSHSTEKTHPLKKNLVNGPTPSPNLTNQVKLPSILTSESVSHTSQPTSSRNSLSSGPSRRFTDNMSCSVPSPPTELPDNTVLSPLEFLSARISTAILSSNSKRNSEVPKVPPSRSNSIQKSSSSIEIPVTSSDIPWHSNQTECTMTEVRLVGGALQERRVMQYFHPDFGCQDDLLRSAFSAYLQNLKNMRLSKKPATVKIAKLLIHAHKESDVKGNFRVKIKHYGKPTSKRFSLCLWNPTRGYVRSPFSEVAGIYEEEEFECPIALSPRRMLYPKAIDDEDELPSETDSSSDEEIEATKARKKKKRVATDFSDKFTFSGVDVVEEDHLDGLKKFLEKRTPSSLQNNIEKERDRLKSALAMDIVDEEEDVSAAKFNGEGAESDSDDSLVQEHASTADKVREKSMKIPKNKLKPNEFFDEASSEIVEAAGKQINLAFQEMNLSRPILKAVTACGYNNPTPIQAACIPVALAGRDICACSATGTGKTAAFMLPILERLLYKSKQKAQTRVLVLVPTRELAIQVFQVSRKLAQFTGVEVCLCAG